MAQQLLCRFCGADITPMALRYGLPTVRIAPKPAYGHARASTVVSTDYSCKAPTCKAALRQAHNVIEIQPTLERIGTENG